MSSANIPVVYTGTADFRLVDSNDTDGATKDVVSFARGEVQQVTKKLWEAIQNNPSLVDVFEEVEGAEEGDVLGDEDLGDLSNGNVEGDTGLPDGPPS